MNRRSFLSSMVGGLAAAAAVRTWPFRVYSFPSEVKICTLADLRDELFMDVPIRYVRMAAEALNRDMALGFKPKPGSRVFIDGRYVV